MVVLIFWYTCHLQTHKTEKNVRPSKQINMFLVRLEEKYQKEGNFIFYLETALDTQIKHDIWRIQRAAQNEI